MIEYDKEHLGAQVGFVVRYVDGVFGMYDVSNGAEEELVGE